MRGGISIPASFFSGFCLVLIVIASGYAVEFFA